MNPISLRSAWTAASLLTVLPASAADTIGAPNPVVTVVQVPKPWYIPAFTLRSAFARAVPEYERLPGLDYKIFTLSEDGARFGGIYLWSDRAAAERWFSPAWHARVRERYGAAGEVRFYVVESMVETRQAAEQARVAIDTPAIATLRVPAIPPTDASRPGLLRRYAVVDAEGTRGEIVLWADRAAAAAVPGENSLAFSAPVLMPGLARRGGTQ